MSRDPAKTKAIQARYYQRHKARILARNKANYAANVERRKAQGREYRKANRAKINAYKRSRAKFRIKAREVAAKLLARVKI